ncbi:hypothetical protein DASC09_055960 [Saccharomycopsis crataegensis]|uniref:chitinase n=1 Tax=Saccharomycopsis crataegensis TaxID=43959 RepID=A0AAV5QV07_9ASCO|nr:hypothetical protein DASC09_055960 [Saccharomycopsis crataegensis]
MVPSFIAKISGLLMMMVVAVATAGSSSPATNISTSKDTVAIYWGQNSLGYLSNFKNNEKELWWYCNWDSVDIIMLAFMQDFPGTYSSKYETYIPTLSFPHHKDSEFSVNNTAVMSRIAKDIKYCQKRNKKILLSLGGEAGSYGFDSTEQAQEFGHTLWQMFGEKNHTKSNITLPRPFGDSVIDGFDFDIENDQTEGYVTLIETLQNYTSSSTKKKYYYSAAPQCPYPDQNMNTILAGNSLDMVFVQFYNNDCNANSNSSFNWDTWADYAQNTSLNSDVQVYLGLPGSVNSSSTGYIETSAELQTLIKSVDSDSHFGGVMLWEASMSFQNKPTDSKNSYPMTIKNILKSQVDNSTVKINGAMDSKKNHMNLALAIVAFGWIILTV